MKIHLAIPLILVMLFIVNIEISATEPPPNIISSLKKSIRLDHWQIVKDSEPKNTLQTPSDFLWQSFEPSFDDNKYTEGNWLIRTNIVIMDSLSDEEIFGLFPLNFVTAYEIYWDEVQIAQNGIIGINKIDETAGQYHFNLPLPPHLITKGKHTLTLRISNHTNYSSWKWFYGDIIIGKYDYLLKKIFQLYYQAFFIVGILFIPFLFNLFLYIARKRKTEHLLFSLICFIVILDSSTFLVPILIDTRTTFLYLGIFYLSANYYFIYNPISRIFHLLVFFS